jgi:hypothetical protein
LSAMLGQMNDGARIILQAALALSPDDRADLAARLLASIIDERAHGLKDKWTSREPKDAAAREVLYYLGESAEVTSGEAEAIRREWEA